MNYIPAPVDTSDVQLSQELLTLTELLAKNTHENWARGRLAEGWVYGPERNDRLKTTPCMVPYEELTDAERHYDRVTAMQTLKLIVKLGYRIEKD